jgi:hypothetical protein
MHTNPLRHRLPEPVRRRLEVASAMAWEALVEVHTANALQFIPLVSDRLPFDEAVLRYLRELHVSEPIALAVKNRVLLALEDAEQAGDDRPALQWFGAERSQEEDSGGWRRFRPDVLMRGVKELHRRHEEMERWVQLAVARAEESVIRSHVNSAITFAALLDEHMPVEKAVQEYLHDQGLSGGRGQAVFQRAMARLAEWHLPAAGESSAEPTGEQGAAAGN